MENQTQLSENQIKIEQIISSAQKIFGQFGMKKTTMKEIADDLGISKASLYYYFPDKEHLYKAVLEKEHSIFLSELDKQLASIDSAEKMLRNYVQVRLQFFKKLINLSRFRVEDWSGMKKVVGPMKETLHEAEIQYISNIMKSGKDAGIFSMDDEVLMAGIFIDSIKGFSQFFFKKKQVIYLDNQEFDLLKSRVELFTSVFIRGLLNNKN